MSNLIKSSDIFEGDIFKIVVDSADLAKTKISELNKELVKVGTSFKEELNGIKTDNVKEINDLIVKVKELTSAVETQTKVNKANEIAIREAKKTSEQALREEEKTKRETLKTQEQINKSNERAVKTQKDLDDAYKKLSANTRDLKNESKRLGAEMLELEKQGKKNSAEYYKLSKQYKETTKSAIEGDKALKKLDSTVGDNFRNVGNYQKALGGLKYALTQLGLAFGVFDGIRALIDTQVKLDSLNLALKNVSGSTKEYQANFAFLKDISLSYGQDLLVLMDTYKNFIASTSSSNLSLAERKRIYESVIKAGSALALSNDNVKGSLLAISQMFSKGTVSAEELRQQLGERLPGAFGIMAESMGVSEATLGDMMKKGQVLADDVMPRFAIMLERAFGSNAKQRLETLGGAWNVLTTNVTLYFDQAQKNININKTLAYVIRTLGENIGSLINTFKDLTIAFATYKAGVVGIELATKLLNGTLFRLDGNLTKFSKSLKTIGWIGAITALIKLTEHWINLSNGIELATKNYNKYRDAQSIGRGRANTLLTEQQIELKKYTTEQKALLDTKQISDKIYAERIKQKKSELKLEIENRLKVIKYYQEAYAQQRNLRIEQSGGKIPKKAGSIDPLLNLLPKSLPSFLGGDYIRYLKLSKESQDEIFKSYNEFNSKIYKLEEERQQYNEYLNAEKTLATPFKGGSGNKGKEKTYAEQDKALRNINTEYKTTTEYLSRHLELMIDIAQFRADSEVIKAQEEYNKALENQQKILESTGEYGFGSIYYASQEEQKAMIVAEQNQYDAKKLKRDIDYKEKYKDLQDNLDKEKEANVKNAEEIETLIALKRKNAQAVLDKKSSSASAKQTAKDNLRWATEQENKLAVDKLAIEQNYQNAKRKIEEEAKKEQRDLNEEEKNDLEKLRIKKEEIIRKSEEKISKDQGDLEKQRAEMRLEVIKNTAESVNNLIQKSLEHYIDLAERRIDILDKRMERMSTQADFLREKAVSGSIQAQESLAQLDVQQMEADKQRINEQKSIQKLQIAMTIFQAYSNNIQSAKVTENPFTKTFTEITALGQLAQAISNGLPAYFDGTEDTGSNGQGVDGKGGFHAVLHPNERVIPKALNSKIGDLSNLEIAKLAEDFHRGEVMRKGDGAMQLNVGSWSTDAIVSKLESLENTIKNKPESNIELGEIVGGVMHIMETKKTGNTKVRNISRFS